MRHTFDFAELAELVFRYLRYDYNPDYLRLYLGER